MFTEKFLHKMPHIQKRTVVIIAGLILIASIGGVFAKYVHYNSGKIQLSAKEFYFTSNLLKEETGKYVLNATATEISFTLGNNADKLRFSQVDITYDISVTTKNGGAVPEVIYANPEHKLLKGAVSETTVTLKNLVKGETYIVTATGDAKYRKVLTAEFTVSGSDEKVYMNLDTSNSAFILLTVWTGNLTGDLSVKTPEGLLPDNTNPMLRDIYNYTGDGYGAIQFTDNKNFDQPYSSYSYRFFVSNKGMGAGEFQVSINGHEAEETAVPE